MENDSARPPRTAEDVVREATVDASRDPLELLSETVARLETQAAAHQLILSILLATRGTMSGLPQNMQGRMIDLLRQIAVQAARSDDPTCIDDLIGATETAFARG